MTLIDMIARILPELETIGKTKTGTSACMTNATFCLLDMAPDDLAIAGVCRERYGLPLLC